MMGEEENGVKELEALRKLVPFAPFATSWGMEWKGLQAVRCPESPYSELNVGGTPRTHVLVLIVQPPEKMDLPGFRLHPMTGDLRGFWSVTVRANWRIIWRYDGADAVDVELIDYH